MEVPGGRGVFARDFPNRTRVDGDGLRAGGQRTAREHRQWLVSALGFELELELSPLMVLCRYDDVPGVIGRVGTLFGEAGINIANMTVSRTRQGEKALMALSIDTPAPPELVARLDAEGFDEVHVVRLDSPAD